jgi:putative transposase
MLDQSTQRGDRLVELNALQTTTGEISAHLAEVYGAEVSKDTISRITDAVLEEMTTWQNRPLDVYSTNAIKSLNARFRRAVKARGSIVTGYSQ